MPPLQDVPCRECALCKFLGYSWETDLQHARHGDFTLPDEYWDPTPDYLAMQDFDRLGGNPATVDDTLLGFLPLILLLLKLN